MGTMIEHWGMVRRIDGDRATIVVETTSCPVCGHGDHCGIGRAAAGGQAAELHLPATRGLKEGDFVTVGLPATGLSLAAMLGYLFPAFTTVLGALLGMHSGGGDASIALGAAAGFVGSLVIARIAIAFTPGLSPTPQILPPSPISAHFSQE